MLDADGVSRDDVCAKALALIADGKPVRRAANELGVAYQTLQMWLSLEKYSGQYAQAREAGWHAMAEEILDVADDGKNDWMEKNDPENPGFVLNGEHVQRSRLRVDSRKWLLSKMLPKVYGDKLETENTTTHKFQGSKDTLAAKINRAFDSGTEGEAG